MDSLIINSIKLSTCKSDYIRLHIGYSQSLQMAIMYLSQFSITDRGDTHTCNLTIQDTCTLPSTPALRLSLMTLVPSWDADGSAATTGPVCK